MIRRSSILIDASLYFALTFAAGFICGAIRVPFVEPQIGPFWAVVAEAPFMLLAMTLAARRVMKRRAARLRLAHQMLVGTLALSMLLAVEAAMDMLMRGHSLSDYAGHFLTPPGRVEACLLAVFVAMPAVIGSSHRR